MSVRCDSPEVVSAEPSTMDDTEKTPLLKSQHLSEKDNEVQSGLAQYQQGRAGNSCTRRQAGVHVGYPPDNIQDGESSTQKDNPPSDELSKDNGNRPYRMALVTLVTFLVSCAGKFHSPVMTQYVYQIYTEMVYGNASAGVHITKHPCINDSDSSSADHLRHEVQDKSADLLMRLDMVSGGIAVFANLFLGAYSDVLGRRFVLLVPFVGHFLRNATVPVIIHWDLGLPALYSGYVLDGLCGGHSGVMLGLYVYAADVTHGDRQRTLGMMLVQAATGLGSAATDVAAGLFIRNTGFFYPSLLASLLLLMCVLIIIVCLPETVPRDQKQFVSPLECAKRMFKVFVSNDHPYQTTLLLLGLFAFFCADLPYVSYSKLQALFVMAHPFCWGSLAIGILGSIQEGVSHVASLFFITLLQRVMQTPLLAIVGAASQAGESLLMALAKTDRMIYISASAGAAKSMLFPAIRSIMSGMVPPDRQGALFAGIAIVESVCCCVGQTVILSVYKAAIPVMPGIVYLFIVGLCTIVIIIYLIYMCLLRKSLVVPYNTLNVQGDTGRTDTP